MPWVRERKALPPAAALASSPAMKAVVVRSHGGLEVLRFEEVPRPEPGPREVRVRLRAAGLNALDTWVRRGVPGHTFPLPLVPGSDGAGTVDAVGPGTTAVAPGDDVMVVPSLACGACEPCSLGRDNLCVRFQILGETRDGTCAEFVVVPEHAVWPKPMQLGYAEAAAFPLVFQTAWAMLVAKAGIRPGETVLVLAAGSGVGSAAVQIAKLHGCRVITTVGAAHKIAKARALGADEVVDRTVERVPDAVRRLTEKRGVDVVFEHVGAATFADSLKCLVRGGRLVTCGATTGAEVQINLRALFFKNLTLIGNTMGRREDLARPLRLLAEGRLRPVVDRVLPLADVAEGHRLLEAGSTFGKVVLQIG